MSEEILPNNPNNREEEAPLPPKRHRHRWLKVVIGLLLSPVLLLLAVSGLLYLPPVQQWAVDTASSYISKASGWEVSVGRIHLHFPLHLDVTNVLALSAQKDTIAHLQHLRGHVPVSPLLEGTLPIHLARVEGLKLDYTLPDSTLTLRGHIDEVELRRGQLYLKTGQYTFGDVHIADGDVYVFYNDSTPPPPKNQEPSSLVLCFDRVSIDRLSGIFTMSRDSNLIDVSIAKGRLLFGEVNIAENYYQAKEIQLQGTLRELGFEYAPLPMPWQVDLALHNGHYDESNVWGDIVNSSLTTHDGWSITSLNARVDKNTDRFVVNDLDVDLRKSRLWGKADLPFTEWIPDTKGEVSVELSGELYPWELRRFFAPEQSMPADPLSLSLQVAGEIDKELSLTARAEMHETLQLSIEGKGQRLLEPQRSAQAEFTLQADNVMRHLHHSGIAAPRWRLPAGSQLMGKLLYDRSRVTLQNLLLRAPRGEVALQGHYALGQQTFKADVDIRGLDLTSFLPMDSIGIVRGHLAGEGHIRDLYDPKSYASLFLNIDSVAYKGEMFKAITLLSKLENNQFFAALNSADPGLSLSSQVDAYLHPHDIDAGINIIVDTLLPSKLGLKPGFLQGISGELRTSFRSDLQERYEVDGEIEAVRLSTDKGTITPANIYIDAFTSGEKLSASLSSGDLEVSFDSRNGLKEFISRIERLSQEISAFTADTAGITDVSQWIPLYPDMKLSFAMGRDNALRTYLDEHLIAWRRVKMDVGTSSTEGLSGEIYLNGFQKADYRVDEMDAVIRQDSSFFLAIATAHKERFKDQLPFNAMVSLTSYIRSNELFAQFSDQNDQNIFQLGVNLVMEPDNDFRFSFAPHQQILAYNVFEPRGGNYLILPAHNRLALLADLSLVGNDGSAIRFHHRPDTPQETHTLIASIKDFGLEKMKDLAFIPDMSGIVNLDAEWTQTPQGDSYQANARVQDLYYDKREIGTVQVAGHLSPQQEGSDLTAQLRLDEVEVATGRLFSPKKENATLRWQAQVKELPLQKANPFLPPATAQLTGFLNATLSNYDTYTPIATAATRDIRGALQLRATKVYVPMLNETYTLDERPLSVHNNAVHFDRFALGADRQSRLLVQGTFLLDDPMSLHLHLSGNDVYLLDSQRTEQTLLYGTLSANTDIELQGPVRAIGISGRLAVNGNTSLSFIAKDNPLEKRDKLEGLIEFTDFSDTLFISKEAALDSLSLGGMNLHLNLHIDPAMNATAILTPDEANKVYLQGGGDFNFAMPPYGAMALHGTFEIGDGYVNYNLPPISRRFDIERGNRVTWSGKVMNPYVDVKATSRIKSNVTLPGETPRRINFDVSLEAQNNVEDLSLLFTIDAPEDLSMRNALSALTAEERGRQAIMMLATGTYITTDGSATSGFDVNSTLSSLLAAQVNSLVGEALDAEINLGVEAASQETGGGTNYSYSIAKKFYNDRINVVVGGRVETGNATKNINQSFINNMSVDYRLDKAGTHYIRLFHNKNYENLLDGEVIETGAGYVLRRRTNHLSDLFRFLSKKAQHPTNTPPPSPTLPESYATKEDEPQQQP